MATTLVLVVDDEPVRLWCYVVFNDRPFKELLTADYTVDEQLRKQPRPEYMVRAMAMDRDAIDRSIAFLAKHLHAESN